MKRAVFYTRVSTADQVGGTSLETQEAWCLAQISKTGMQFVQSYSDPAQSGADENRPAWRALLADAREKKFDAVFVYDLDRFTRDMLHGLQATRDLRELGVALYDAKDPTSDAASVDAQLMTGFRLLIAEEERRKIKERTVRGQRAKLESGEWAGGKPSYGWKLEGIRTRKAFVVPDEQERRVLFKLYGWVVRDKKTTGEICDLLNANGIKSRTGKRWSHAVIRKILSNPSLYRGWFIWGSPDQGSEDKRSHKTKIDREGRPLYGLPKKVFLPEPPFTEKEFKALQRALNSHPRARGMNSVAVSRPLTGRLIGACGKHYTGTSIARKDYDVYRCTGNRSRGNELGNTKCGCAQINAQKIEARIWGEVSRLISDPIKLQNLAQNWLNLQIEHGDSSVTELETLENQELKLRRAISRIQDDYYLADSKEQDSLRNRIEKFRADLDVIQSRKKLISAYVDDSALQARQFTSLAELAKSAQSRLSKLNMDEQREIYELLRIKVLMSQVEKSEPGVITIFGHIDSRISKATFLDGDNEVSIPQMEFTIPQSSQSSKQ